MTQDKNPKRLFREWVRYLFIYANWFCVVLLVYVAVSPAIGYRATREGYAKELLNRTVFIEKGFAVGYLVYERSSTDRHLRGQATFSYFAMEKNIEVDYDNGMYAWYYYSGRPGEFVTYCYSNEPWVQLITLWVVLSLWAVVFTWGSVNVHNRRQEMRGNSRATK